MSESNFHTLYPELLSLSMRGGHFCRFRDHEWTCGDNNDDMIWQRWCWGERWKEMDFSELRCLFSQPRLSWQSGLTTIAKRLWIEWGGDESGWYPHSDDEDKALKTKDQITFNILWKVLTGTFLIRMEIFQMSGHLWDYMYYKSETWLLIFSTNWNLHLTLDI